MALHCLICLVLIGGVFEAGHRAVMDVEAEFVLFLANPRWFQKLHSRKQVGGYVERMSLMVLFWTFTSPQKLLLFRWVITEIILRILWMNLSLT